MDNLDKLIRALEDKDKKVENTSSKTSFLQNIPWGTVLNLALVGVLVYFLVFNNKDEVSPTPDPVNVNVVKVVEKAETENLLAKAAIYKEIADRVDSGEITSAEQISVNFKEMQDKVQSDIYKEVELLDTEVFNDWSNKDKISKYLRDSANGCERVVK